MKIRTRPPAVAGMFYPADANVLSQQVDTMLAQASCTVAIRPKALIVPHAGYIYSGSIAASAYTLLQEMEHIRRVVLLGPVHRVPVSGLALPEADSFSTPLGDIPLDQEAMESIAQLPQVIWSEAAHAMEHSLEVHLPFLQRVLGEFQLVPLAVGDASPEDVAGVLDVLWGDDKTLIVISSDLSHYLPYQQAQQVDRVTADNILAKQWPISHEQACGATPINGLLATADKHELTPHLLDLRNSGDTAGDKQQVVGYGAFAFDEKNG
ncbi:MAG: AmmeMemoRadiSam system protein B [Mariprofundaceae bacterium]|nr:AmmeMemoRadiSam system protein B [Mariprofundaceae bacterium]